MEQRGQGARGMSSTEWNGAPVSLALLDQSVQDLTLLAEHRLTSTWEVFSASEMGTFGEPKLRDFATTGALAIFT